MSVYRWDGSQWVEVTQVGVYDGSQFVDGTVNAYDGSSWVDIWPGSGSVGGGTEGVSRWSLDGGGSDSWGSNTATLNNGTYDDTEFIEGTHSASFDATSTYISLPTFSNVSFDGSMDWSISHLVRFTDPGFLFHPREQADVNTAINSNNEFEFGWWDTSGSAAATTSALSTGTWYHLVGVWDSTNAEIRAYVDGNLSATAADGSPYATTSNNVIGYRPDNSSNYFGGHVDDVRLYDWALTDTEVSDLFNTYDMSGSGGGTSEPTIDHQWAMDDGSGSTITDTAGNQDLTLASGTWGSNFVTFDGASDHATATDNNNYYTALDDFSLFGWVRLHDTSDTNTDAFCGSYDTNGDRSWYAWYSNNGLSLNTSTDGANFTRDDVAYTATQDTWFSFAFVRDSASGDFDVYADAAHQGTGTADSGTLYGNSIDFFVGMRGDGRYMDGDMAELVMTKNYQYSSSEVQWLHDNTDPR